VWSYLLDTNFAFSANFIISEMMASNANGIQDDDGARSDWIEIRNLGPQQASLDGWFLTDASATPTMWRFPFGLPPVQPSGYVLVWASGKNRTNAFAPLHTNFKLSSSSGYLALVSPATNVVSAFDPYPDQVSDISYGRDQVDPGITGFFTTPTPGKTNTVSGPGFMAPPEISVASGVYTNDNLLVTMSSASGTIRYTFNGNSPLTNGTTSFTYTNSFVISNSTLLKVRVFPPAGSTLWPSPVVARNIIFLDNTSRDFSSELPLMVISTQGQAVQADVAPGGKRTEGILCLIDTTNGRSALQAPPDFIGNVGVEIFGQTSAGFSKPPYRIEIHDELGNDLPVSVFGLPAESDFKLRNPFDDKTLMNDFLGYELFEKMGHYSCRRRLVEVFVDSGGGRLKYPGDYTGVEVLFETIKQGANRVNIAKVPPTATNEPAITGGYIFKKDKDSNGDLNFNTSGGGTVAGGGPFPGEALKMHEPKPNEFRSAPLASRLTPGGSNQLNYLVKYLNRMERAMYTNNWLQQTGTNHYSSYLDVDSFVDFHWLVEFTKQIDGVRLSSYFTKDRGGKVQAGPVWDWNLSFGNANYWTGGYTNGWYYSIEDNPPWGMTANEHIWLRRLINGNARMGPPLPDGSGDSPGPGGDPDFNQKIADRWSVLRTNLFNATNLMGRIDEVSSLLAEAAARDLWGRYRGEIVGVYVWPNPDGTGEGRDVNYVAPTNYLGNDARSIIWQMKKFVQGRYLWIDHQFTPVPLLSGPGGQVPEGYPVTVTPPANATLYYTLDGSDPRAPGGGVAAGALSNSSAVSLTVSTNIRLFARAYATGSWYRTWSGPVVESYLRTTPALRITEVMYSPQAPASGTYAASDFEFIEVRNTGSSDLNLARAALSGGVTFTFPDLTVPAGGRVVVVSNPDAFRTRYPDSSIVVAGQFVGNLNNAGDHIVLTGPRGEPLHDFTYDPAWAPATDGHGFALVPLDETASPETWAQRTTWRAGTKPGGTPGGAEPAATGIPAVVINELLSHSVSPAVDVVELHNPGDTAAEIGGWFLTDNASNPFKYRIPDGTVLVPHGYKLFTEAQFNKGTTAFAFSGTGEEVYLFSADAAGNLTGYAHGFRFGAQVASATFGRVVTSDGIEHFVTQTQPSLGLPNAGPLVGPLVVSEIMYHPPELYKYAGNMDDSLSEYIELRNISASPLPLFDATAPTNTWHLENAVTYAFPTNVTVDAGAIVIVVGFDPANAWKLGPFRQRYGIPAGVPVFGPWTGKLANSGAAVVLTMPDHPIAAPASNAGFVPYVSVDEVHYRDAAPWPAGADGFGASLHRVALTEFGDDPLNWAAGLPSPGAPFSGGVQPAISVQPADVSVVTTNAASAVFSVEATGPGPFHYQWLYNGVVIPGQTNATLTVQNVTGAKAGLYEAVVVGAGGVTASTRATLSTVVPVSIAIPPLATGVKPGSNTVLSVLAVSPRPISYQWYFNTQPIPGANDALLNITNARLSDDGLYSVLVRDAVSSQLSDPARLSVLVPPVIAVQPSSQSVLKGGSVILSVVLSNTATMPNTYRWRRGTTTVITQATNSLVSYLLITNIQTSVSNYNVAISNLAVKTFINSSNAVVQVVSDADGDGLPDDYENQYPAFLNPNDPSDAAKDYDGDGAGNLAEYIAGTDPSDPKSYLRIDRIHVDGQGTRLQLYVRSNHTYTVEFREGAAQGIWQGLTNIPAQVVEGALDVTDPYPTTASRIYRLATPVRTDRAIRTPVILASPQPTTVVRGASVTLSAQAYGLGTLSYQWRVNGQDIPGATSDALGIPQAQSADQGDYSVRVTDDTGSVLSDAGRVVVLDPPNIVSAPAPVSVHAGATARFLVGATGNAPLTYRWLFNDSPIAGATGPTLVINPVAAEDVGLYRVIVSHNTVNGPVSAKSDPVELTLIP
jgi:hypothetical protein